MEDKDDNNQFSFSPKLFLDISQDIFCVFDYEGYFKWVNPAFEKILGYSQEETIGKRGIEFFHPEDKVLTITEREKAATANQPSICFANRALCKDGAIKWIEWSSIPLPEERLFYAVGREITSYQTIQDQLKESEEKFRTSIENMMDCFAIFSAVRNGSGQITDFLIDYVNDGICQRLQIEREKLIGQSLLESLPDHQTNGLFAKYCEVVESGNPLAQKVVYEGLFSNGRKIEGIFEQRVVKLKDGFALSYRDITEQERIEEKLKASEETFSKAFRLNPNIMIMKRTDNGQVVNVSQLFSDVMGYGPDEIIGKRISELDIWTGLNHKEEIGKRLSIGGKIRNLEIEFRTKFGEVKKGLVSADIIEIRGIKHVLISINDVTELNKMKQEMERLSQLNLIGQMAAGIGHEIRNPMTSIRGFLQLLIGKEECSSYRKYFEMMIEELDRTNSIITEFLSLTKSKPTSLARKNLNAIVNSLYPLLLADTINADKNIVLETDDTPDLLLDEKEIRQLILNLFRNGLEAMSATGTITIKTYVEGEEVVLTVKDQGAGIDLQILERIGTPFFTTKDEGVGLGLAVCYSIASRHRAAIDIQTTPTGATFLIKFKIEDLE